MAYRVGEFAALTGVTVRALQHYDRLGLLKVSRTESGHRVFRHADRERVRHILALRAIGMSLHQIADVLTRPQAELATVLLGQRERLRQARAGIDEALHVLEHVEADDRPGRSVLDRLAAGVEMKDTLAAMRQYFTDDAWEKWGRNYFYDWPSAAWRALFREIEASLDEDPASIHAQHLLDRSAALWDANIRSEPQLVRAVREGYGKAWQSRDRWPRELQQRYAEFRIAEIARFLGAAQIVSWRRRGLIHTYTAGHRSTA